MHEIKFDGYRAQLRVADGEATVFSRNGLDWTHRFPEIARLAPVVLMEGLYDGEICALDEHAMPDFAALLDALSAKRTRGLVLFLFDALAIDGEDLRDRPLIERKARLEAELAGEARPGLAVIRYVEHWTGDARKFHRSACEMGLEGMVSKRADAPYRSGKPGSWTKAKCRAGQELVIGGWEMNGASFRSLLTGVYRDGQFEYAGSVGSGFGAAQVAAVLPRLKALETRTSPFTGQRAPRKSPEIHWCRPELVAQVEFAGWVGSDRGRIRQASFKGLREDKPATAVTREKAS